jgi:radical SAM superfamily enzyme YgiQ (UPF0313 family)
MKIVFIDPTESTINYGLRVMASYLNKNGHNASIVFLPPPKINYYYNYPESVYNDLYEIIKDADIVGLSFVTYFVSQAKFITKFIHEKSGIPVIWGGIHATSQPEESLEYADFVCLGEGEEAMLTLLNKMNEGEDYTTTRNFFLKNNENIIKNDVLPLSRNLDKYPFPMYDTNREYIRVDDRIINKNPDITRDLFKVSGNFFGFPDREFHTYITLGSRGCRHHCTYCGNNTLNKLYHNETGIVRHRSCEHLISELEFMLNKFPYVDLIQFFDDDFFCSSIEYVREFAKQYKARIHLPFRCNFTPSFVNEKKIALLADAGLITIEMGLQTASERTNKEIFKRSFEKKEFLNAVYTINKHKEIYSNYDIILDNPFENYKDNKETLRFLAKLPAPFKLNIFSMTFFPGSELYDYAKKEEMIKDEIEEIYNKANCKYYEDRDSYIKFLIFLIRVSKRINFMPYTLFKILSSENTMKVLNSIYCQWFFRFLLKIKARIRYKMARVEIKN